MISAIGEDSFIAFAELLSLRDLSMCLRACKEWKAVLDSSEHLWGLLCEKTWRDKVYVPASLRVLAGGETAVAAATKKARSDLCALRVGELKDRIRALRVRIEPGRCFLEKQDFVDAIESSLSRRAELASFTEKLLTSPVLLRRSHEALPKTALRLSLLDAKRTRLTADELCRFVFNVRLRGDGPLADATPYDPWWMGCGRGEARFSDSGSLSFTWPTSESGEVLDPFLVLGMPNIPDSVGWRLEHDGAYVQLVMMGHDGPREVVSRHRGTWGWILFSNGSCWTSWEMPSRAAADPILADENLRYLPSFLN